MIGPLPIDLAWISDGRDHTLANDSFEAIGVDGSVVLRPWAGDPIELAGSSFFGDGPARAAVLDIEALGGALLIIGEGGPTVGQLDAATGVWTTVSEITRPDDDVGGMRLLEMFVVESFVLIHWEIGLLAIGFDADVRWRCELSWNHRLLSIDSAGAHFEPLYEELRNVGSTRAFEPWTIALDTGQVVPRGDS